jgi:hypothetical protein
VDPEPANIGRAGFEGNRDGIELLYRNQIGPAMTRAHPFGRQLAERLLEVSNDGIAHLKQIDVEPERLAGRNG